MPLTNLEQTAAQNDWDQERIDRAQAAMEQTEHFNASDKSHDGEQVQKLAATTQIALAEIAMHQDVDQDRLDEMLKRAK